MAPKTLYDIVRPICWRLNMFGYNYGNEKPAGWMKRGYKFLLKCLLMNAMWKKMIKNCESIRPYSWYYLSIIIWESLLIASFCLQFFFMKEAEMEDMFKKMKQHPVVEMSQKNLNKQLIPFKIYSALFVILSLVKFSGDLFYLIFVFQEGRASFIWTVFSIISCAYFYMVLQFPSLVCILPCIVACYCRAEMEEAIEEMKKVKSPLRRTKAGAKLMEKYRQLYELASVTDRALSTAMYFIKWMLFISLAADVLTYTLMSNDHKLMAQNINYILEAYNQILISNSLIVVYFPLFQYFYLAPSANQMFERMNRAIVDCGFIDDQWLSRDPITGPYLLKMRMEQMERVSHMSTEDPPFTLFGVVLDDDIKYAVILELIDMCNTLGVHENSEEMTPSRIFHDFMRRCIDCDYWSIYI